MNDEVYMYRLTKPKCKYCKYFYYKFLSQGISYAEIQECVAKDKHIIFPSIPRPFCSLYSPKKEY